MTKEEFYQQVVEDFQRQIWDIELKQAFNRKRIEELEHDLGKPEIIIPGDKQAKKAWGAMQQELSKRRGVEGTFIQKIQDIKEQLDFVSSLIQAENK